MSPTAGSRAPDPSRRRILIVEDDYLVALQFENALTEAGYDVVDIASTAEEAVQQLTHDRVRRLVLRARVPDRADEVPVSHCPAPTGRGSLGRRGGTPNEATPATRSIALSTIRDVAARTIASAWPSRPASSAAITASLTPIPPGAKKATRPVSHARAKTPM